MKKKTNKSPKNFLQTEKNGLNKDIPSKSLNNNIKAEEKAFFKSEDELSLTENNINKKEQEIADRLQERKSKLFRFFIATALIVVLVLAIYLPLKLTGSLDRISSSEQLKEMILNAGFWGYLIFFAIQFIQVSFIPIPAVITTLAGVIVFGPWHALWISLVSVLLASIFSFWLGRKFGKKLIYWIIGKKEAEKYNEKLEKGKYVFFLMMLFPGFPDDILCMLVGMTNMTFKFFLITNLITRPIAFSVIIFFGSGHIIPFSGWGIYAWIIIAILMVVAFYISVKKQQQIENFLLKLSNRLKKEELNRISKKENK